MENQHEHLPFEMVEQNPPALNNGEGAILKREETADERIIQEIKKFHLPDAEIAKMKKEFGKLKIRQLPAPEDKAGMKLYREEKEKVQKALAVVRGVRTGLEKKRKELKADYLKIGKGIDGEAERLTTIVSPLELTLKEQWDASEKAEEDRKNEAERLAQEKLQGRVRDLLEAGIQFDGSFYSIGDISVDVVTLKTFPDENFSALLGKVREVKAKKDEEARLEAERLEAEKRKEEEARLELKRQQEELQQQQAELQKQKEELAAAQEKQRQQVISSRRTSIEGLGLGWNGSLLIFQNPSGKVEVRVEEITESSEEQWATILSNVAGLVKEIQDKEAKRIQELKDKEAEAHRLSTRRNARIGQLQTIGFLVNPNTEYVGYVKEGVKPFEITFETIGGIPEDNWPKQFMEWGNAADEINVAWKKLEGEKAAKLEADRKASMEESELISEYFAKVNAIERPNIKNREWQMATGDFFRELDGILESFKESAGK